MKNVRRLSFRRLDAASVDKALKAAAVRLLHGRSVLFKLVFPHVVPVLSLKMGQVSAVKIMAISV